MTWMMAGLLTIIRSCGCANEFADIMSLQTAAAAAAAAAVTAGFQRAPVPWWAIMVVDIGLLLNLALFTLPLYRCARVGGGSSGCSGRSRGHQALIIFVPDVIRGKAGGGVGL
jgi:hypothetical protein